MHQDLGEQMKVDVAREQDPHDGDRARVRREHQRRPAKLHCSFATDKAPPSSLSQACVKKCCNMAANLVLGVGVCAGLEEEENDIGVAPKRGQHQRRLVGLDRSRRTPHADPKTRSGPIA